MLEPPSPDIAQALTPAAAFYLDPAQLQRELDSVFAANWLLVSQVGPLAADGNYQVVRAGSESLVLVNDGGRLRGYFNVCRHRAGPLANGCGNARKLVCRYHGWTYDLAGQLLRAPEMDGVDNFDPARISLREVRLQQFGPLIFAALNADVPPFDDMHPGLALECAPLDLAPMQHLMTRDYPVAANWKAYVDNYLEGYHIPLIHPALDRELDYRAYVTRLAPRRVLQFAPVRKATALHYRDGAGDGQAYYYWLHPNIMLNIYEGLLQTNVVIPIDAGHSVVRFDWYARAPLPDPASDPRFQQLLQFTEQIQAEDAAICAAVQHNFASRAFEVGRYSVQREAGPHHFHRLVLGG
jgi:choline monooxygenase